MFSFPHLTYTHPIQSIITFKHSWYLKAPHVPMAIHLKTPVNRPCITMSWAVYLLLNVRGMIRILGGPARAIMLVILPLPFHPLHFLLQHRGDLENFRFPNFAVAQQISNAVLMYSPALPQMRLLAAGTLVLLAVPTSFPRNVLARLITSVALREE